MRNEKPLCHGNVSRAVAVVVVHQVFLDWRAVTAGEQADGFGRAHCACPSTLYRRVMSPPWALTRHMTPSHCCVSTHSVQNTWTGRSEGKVHVPRCLGKKLLSRMVVQKHHAYTFFPQMQEVLISLAADNPPAPAAQQPRRADRPKTRQTRVRRSATKKALIRGKKTRKENLHMDPQNRPSHPGSRNPCEVRDTDARRSAGRLACARCAP